MNKRISGAIIFTILLTIPAHSVVQLFDRGRGGIVPYLGVLVHPDVTQWSAGFGYNIEGRASIGIDYSQPLSDTLFDSHSEIKSRLIRPYLTMEIMEPDKVFPVGVSLNVSYQYYLGREENANGIPIREYWQNQFEGGPEISGRFFVGDAGMIIPSGGYGLIWSTTHRRPPNPQGTAVGNITETDGFMHNIKFRLIYSHMLSEVLGIMADPQINTQLDSDNNVDIYGKLNIGLVIRVR